MPAKPKIVITRRLPDAVEARLARDYDPVLNPGDDPLDGNAIAALCAGADALLCSPTERIGADVVARLPGTVRIIATYSVGYDHVDVAAAHARAIIVTNTPDVLTEATADIAMLCLLGAARRAHEGNRLVRERRWRRWEPTGLLGVDLNGRRLGIVGMGRIGRAVARRALGFGLKVLYTGRKPVLWTGLGSVTFVPELDDLLAQSDFLSLHVPAFRGAPPLLNAERIARLPRGAVVVNTARGSLIDDEALIAALRSGHIAAAGLDVFRSEPEVHPGYLELDNTFLLPHLGSATVDTRNAMGFRALDNLDAFFGGRRPLDVVGDRP